MENTLATELKKARRLSGIGRFENADVILKPLVDAHPKNAQVALVYAKTRRALGDLQTAAHMLETAVANGLGAIPAQRERIEIALAGGELEKALSLCRSEAPDLAGTLPMQMLEARVLRDSGQVAEADAKLQHLHAQFGQDQNIKMAYARSRRAMGDVETAHRLVREVLHRNNQKPAALIEHIDLSILQGDFNSALQTAKEAVEYHRQHVPLALKYAQVLRKLGRIDEASTYLDTLRQRFPRSRRIRSAALSTSDVDSYANQLSSALKRAKNTNRPDAWANVTSLAKAFKDIGAPQVPGAILGPALFAQDAAGAENGAAPHWVDHVGLPNALSLCAMLPTPTIYSTVSQIMALATDRKQLSDAALADFVAVSAQFADARFMQTSIDFINARSQVPYPIAKDLRDLAVASENEELCARVISALAQKVPANLRFEFTVHSAGVLNGPFAALHASRRARPQHRDRAQTVIRLRALLNAGRARVVYRYLKAFFYDDLHQMPLFQPWVSCLRQLGLAQEALDWVLANKSKIEAQQAFVLHRSALIECEKRDEAVALIQHARATNPHWRNSMDELVFLAKQGERQSGHMVKDALLNSLDLHESTKAHFSITLAGSLLSELDVYHQSYGEEERRTPSAERAARFYHAAHPVITDLPAVVPGVVWGDQSTRLAPVRRVFQYWDDPEIPKDIDQITRSWQDLPGWSYQLFNRKTASAWLAKELGPKAKRAFQLANHVAEESDFFRLCVLAKEGGLYADADDLLIGDVEDLYNVASGLLMVRETHGGLANNFMLAAPGHPVIRRAFALAKAALLRRDNDNTWSKTGPGLVTRAAATCVLENPQLSPERFQCVSEADFQKYVKLHMNTAHKARPTYWNSTGAVAHGGVNAALEKMAVE